MRMGYAHNTKASLLSAFAVVLPPAEAVENGNEYYGWFDFIVDTVEPFYNQFIDFITDFYAQYGALGMLVGLVVVALAVVAVVYAFRFIGFLLRSIKRLFLKVTGIERRRREKADQARLQKRVRGANYNELLNWGKATEARTGENFWEDVVAKAAAEVAEARAPSRENEDEIWEGFFSGAVPYAGKLSDIERAVFSFEDKIHGLIGRITTMPKDELASETGRLRYGLEILRNDTDRLKKLHELFPDDVNISSLVELCEAFIQSTKNIEKGFLAALAS